MMQHFDYQYALKEFLTQTPTRFWNMSYSRLRIGLLLVGIVVVLSISAISINSASAQTSVDIFTFCSKPTTLFTGFYHCQIGDKDYWGWYDKTIPKSLPAISTLKMKNVNRNPISRGKFTIFMPKLYCGKFWWDRIGHGYIEVNGQRFATCPGDEKNLGRDGFNDGADYLFSGNMVRIITNISVVVAEAVRIKLFGRVYAQTHDDCRKALYGVCQYPAISSCWLYAYSKTTAATNELTKFYLDNNTSGTRKIYDFVTISVADMDLDNHIDDYYDCEDWQMTFALTK